MHNFDLGYPSPLTLLIYLYLDKYILVYPMRGLFVCDFVCVCGGVCVCFVLFYFVFFYIFVFVLFFNMYDVMSFLHTFASQKDLTSALL